MLTTEDKEEVKRLVGEMIAESGPTHSERRKHPDDIEDLDRLQNIVDVTARAIEVFGTREKALRWLKTPVRSLDDQTPISLLKNPEGVDRVQDILGRVEHGIW
jgi:putative toxin-antitoxin system antitoxin component (TIGR02293 family)